MAALMLLAEDPLIAKARALLSVEKRCEIAPDITDVTVCGLRRADTFRVPFIIHDEGDPRYESVRAERVRLLNRTTPVHDMGPFQVESGMAGVSVGTYGVHGTTRKIAP